MPVDDGFDDRFTTGDRFWLGENEDVAADLA